MPRKLRFSKGSRFARKCFRPLGYRKIIQRDTLHDLQKISSIIIGDMSTSMQQERLAILDAMLAIVPFEGWTEQSLAAAAKQAGYDDVTLYRAFPGSVTECVAFFTETADKHMLQLLDAQDLKAMKVRQRIATIIMARLAYYQLHREAVRRMLAWFALPPHAMQGMHSLYNTVDAMWYAAGDTSTDFNFYTKRATLATVYSSTLLVWLDDDTPDQKTTREFLDRRIANVMQIEGLKQGGRKYMQKFFSLFSRAS